MDGYLFKQSLNGLQTTAVFTAPLAGIYFIQGNLQLPNAQGAGASSVVAAINKNGSAVYTGNAGASGFNLPALTLAAADAITVVLSSSAAVDNTINAVSGQVVAGIGV